MSLRKYNYSLRNNTEKRSSQVSHPYKTKGKLIDLRILNSIFSERNRDEKRLRTAL